MVWTDLERADMHCQQVCLFELKVIEQAGAGAALAQLVERGYAEKYRGRGAPVHLLGVEFSSRTRNVERSRSTSSTSASRRCCSRRAT